MQLQSCWWRQSAVAELLLCWSVEALKRKRKNRKKKKKPTKRVSPHDPRVNPTQTIFKMGRVRVDPFFDGFENLLPIPIFYPGFGRVNESGSNFARYHHMTLVILTPYFSFF